MEEIIEVLNNISVQCQENFNKGQSLTDQMQKLIEASHRIGQSWSGSWLGYHSCIYKTGFSPREPGDFFDAMYATAGPPLNRTRGDWSQYDKHYVMDYIIELSECIPTQEIDLERKPYSRSFSKFKGDVLLHISALLSVYKDSYLTKAEEMIESIKPYLSARDIAMLDAPKQIRTSDRVALQEGIRIPPHIAVQSFALETISHVSQLEQLSIATQNVAKYLKNKTKLSTERDRIKEILSVDASTSHEVAHHPFGNLNYIGNMIGSQIGFMGKDGRSKKSTVGQINNVPQTEQMTSDEYEQDVLDILTALVNSKEDLEDKYSELKSIFTKLMAIEHGGPHVVQEDISLHLSQADIQSLTRFYAQAKNSSSQILHGIISNTLFSTYILPLIT